MQNENTSASSAVVVLVPLFNDWTALDLLVRKLDTVSTGGKRFQLVVVDDASTVAPDENFGRAEFVNIDKILVLRLRRNLGHQRAICVGLVYIHNNYPLATTVVMDADGEDNPEDIPRLLLKLGSDPNGSVVFAERRKRTESFTFKMFYSLYRLAHRILTGMAVRVGNFSAIPSSCLASLVVISETWNHYAAAVFHGRLPYVSVPTTRGTRLAGRSRMNFVSLVVHGLSAISVYGDRVGVRMLVVSVLLMLLVIAAIATTFAIRFYTNMAIAGWATYVTGLLLVLLMQVVSISFMFAFLILNSRSQTTFLPIRDCPFFMGELRTIYSRDSA